jgi:hypothetical protein
MALLLDIGGIFLFYLYKWDNLKEDSPQESTRNEWLYKYGAFARKDGLWFPCKVLRYSTIGEPATIMAVPLATVNMDIYPKGEISVDSCEVLYTIFANGLSIQAYIQKAMYRKHITDKMLNAALRRSLNTELLFAPKRLLKDVKKAANREDKEESYVLTVNNKDEIGAVELPRTIDIVEKLWDSNDWAKLEISQLLGISYNPVQGKKERMLQSELLGDRDLTVMNREMITSRLINSAKKFDESIVHISTEIDTIDRNLSYGKAVAQEADTNNDDSI